jgi:negative regulator of flagellin synthesis FlgM
MDIKQIPGQTSQQQIESGKTRQSADNVNSEQSQQKQAVTASSEDRVELSGLADKLKITLASLDSVAEVNTDKVASLKNAIESGNYQVNSANISDKLIKFELSFPE